MVNQHTEKLLNEALNDLAELKKLQKYSYLPDAKLKYGEHTGFIPINDYKNLQASYKNL
jgi:hypothetical protein